MTNWEKRIQGLLEYCEGLRVKKAQEYATADDRLHNFNVAAALSGITPEQALWGMAVKHVISLSDMIQSEQYYRKEVWREKIGDMLNYLLLLWLLVVEQDDINAEEDSRLSEGGGDSD